jgi:HK97 gp10 family phage protein
VEVKVTGLKEIEAQLINLGSKNGTRIIRRALLIAAEPIIEQARHNAPKKSGALALSIGRRFVAGARGDAVKILPEMGSRFAVVIAPFKGNRVATALHNLVYGRKRKGIFYGHLIEWGHRVVSRLSSVSVAANPFLGPALRDRARDAVNIFRAEVRDGINKEIKRLKRK